MSECQNCCSKPCECRTNELLRDAHNNVKLELAALRAERDGIAWEKEQIRAFADELRRLAALHLEAWDAFVAHRDFEGYDAKLATVNETRAALRAHLEGGKDGEG
jgi:hypothetical protein